MRRRLVFGAGALVAVVLLTGCNLSSKIVVQPNGAGTYSVVMTVPDGPSHPGQALYQAVQQGAAHSVIPVSVTPYTAGGSSGVRTTFNFKSLADLNAESRALATGGGGAIGVTLTRDSSGWHFGASTQSLLTPPSSLHAGETGGAISATSLTSSLSVQVVVQLPGAPGHSNAKTVTHSSSSSTFTWNMGPGQAGGVLQASTTFVGNQSSVALSSARTHLVSQSARATVSHGAGSSGGLVLVVVLVAVVACLALGGLYLRRRVQA